MNVYVKNLMTAMLVPAVLCAQSGSGLSDAKPISLDEAVRLAQVNQPQTVSARNALRTGESSVRTQLLGYLPQPSLGMSASQRGGTQIVQGVPLPLTGNPWSYSRSLSFGTVTLFDGGSRWNNYRSAQANLNVSEASLVTSSYGVALNVKTSYYAILSAREQQSAAERQLEQAQQQLRVSTAKMAAGSATRTDSLSGAIAVANAKQAILNAQNALLNANAQLTRYVATPFTVTAMPADTADIAPIGVDDAALLTMALEGPSVKQTNAALAAAQATQRAAKAPYLPTITMNGSYGQTPLASKTFDWGSGTSSTSTSLGFNVNYPLFDGYRREQTLVSARVGLENAEANLRDAKFLAQQNLTTQLNTYRTALLSIDLSKLNIQASEENLRVVQQQYNLGTKQLLDLLTAQTSLDNARTSLITARQNARLAKANIESIIGRDLK
jgi:outer membrane protein